MYKTLYTREYQQMLALLRAKRTDAQVSQVELARRLGMVCTTTVDAAVVG